MLTWKTVNKDLFCGSTTAKFNLWYYVSVIIHILYNYNSKPLSQMVLCYLFTL